MEQAVLMKTILVTGGAGYIGSHTAHLLAKKGFDVIVFDSLEKGHRESLPKMAKLIVGNLADEKLLDKTFSENRIDAVLHFAGYSEAGESMREPLRFFQNNVSNGINLLKAMAKHKVNQIVFSSTAAVYGQPEKMPIGEDFDKKPTNYYGLSKLIFEQILDASKVYGIRNICLRYFNAAGAGFGIGEDHSPETHIIPLIMQAALGKIGSIKIFGGDYPTKDGTCIRDYVHVLDLAEAHLIALDAIGHGKEGKYNVATGRGHSVKEVVDAVKKLAKKDFKVEIVQKREGDPAELIASPERIIGELGWKPRYSLKDIVKSAWEWHSNNPDGFA